MRLSKTSHNLERWVAIRTDALGASFTAVLATYLLLKKDASAGSVGFSLLMVLGFCSRILQWVRNWNDFEIQANRLIYPGTSFDLKLIFIIALSAFKPVWKSHMNKNLLVKDFLQLLGPQADNSLSKDYRPGILT